MSKYSAPTRRMATRATPDPEVSPGSSFSSSFGPGSRDNSHLDISYRDNSHRETTPFDDDVDAGTGSSQEEEADGNRSRSQIKSPGAKSPKSEKKLPTPVSPSFPKKRTGESPRAGARRAEIYPSNPSPSSPRLYPDLSDMDSPVLRERASVGPRKPLHGSPPYGSPSVTSTSTPRGGGARSPHGNRPRTAEQPGFLEQYLPHCAICFVILLVVVCLFLRPFASPAPEPAEVDEPTAEQIRREILAAFKSNMKELQAEFPSQSDRFWKVLKAATKRVMREPHPLQPAILLLAGDNVSMPTLECLSVKLSDVVTRSYGGVGTPVTINHHRHSSLSPEELKLLIDTTLRRSFEAESRAAVVYDIGTLPGEAAMMFHAYCDHENAPYKDTVIILTVNLGEVRASAHAQRTDDSLVENFLHTQYSDDLDNDRLSALLSRIANNIAFVEGETAEVLNTVC